MNNHDQSQITMNNSEEEKENDETRRDDDGDGDGDGDDDDDDDDNEDDDEDDDNAMRQQDTCVIVHEEEEVEAKAKAKVKFGDSTINIQQDNGREEVEEEVEEEDGDENGVGGYSRHQKKTCCSDVPPPGPKLFVDWYTKTTTTATAAAASLLVSSEYYNTDNDNNHNNDRDDHYLKQRIRSSQVEQQQQQQQQHQEDQLHYTNVNDDIESSRNIFPVVDDRATLAVRRFVGPFDDSLAIQFRSRRNQNLRRRHNNTSNSNSNTTGTGISIAAPSYECASYKKMDTPVFQHYCYSLAKQHQEKQRLHNIKVIRNRKSTLVTSKTISILPPQKDRFFVGLLRWLITFPTARQHSKNNPIGAYQLEERYIIRLVLIMVGIVAAAIIWTTVNLSEIFVIWKLNFVTNPVRFNGDGNYNSSTSSNITALAVENFRNNITGKLNITAASDAATLFVTTRTTDFDSSGYYGLPMGFGCFLGFNVFFTVLAFLPVMYRPMSGGSGIAEAKATLNGIIIPTVTDIITGLCKAISVIFAGAASLPIGLEGPLIFIGLAIGDNAQRFIPQAYPALKMDEMKRDFAVVGCACGVAGAFLTPIGGVLFAMEEGASFWNTTLAWRSFASACVTTILFYFLNWAKSMVEDVISGNISAMHSKSIMTIHDMAIYSGLKTEGYRGEPSFRIYDFFVFALIGILAGVLGALWIEANCYVSKFRRRFIGSNQIKKFAELLTLSILTTCVLWFVPLLYTRCTPNEAINVIDKTILRQMNCPDGYYNQLGTLFLNPSGSVGLNLLYWERYHSFDALSLFIAGFSYHILLLLLFGSSTAMGIFIPLLYVGALYGRALANLAVLHTNFIPDGLTDPAIILLYTMVTSVAILAGVVRVLISITVIMMCSIGVTYLITPFMVATLFAKVIGKAIFGKPGIYDCILETKGVPFLETECPKSVISRGLCAKDIMSRAPLISLRPEQGIGPLLDCLKKYPGIADFPVIDSSRGGILLGVVTKRAVLTILSHRELFYNRGDNSTCALKFDQFILERVKRVKLDMSTVLEIETNNDREKVVDLTPYLEIGHDTVNQFVSVHRTYELFRSLGLRALIVADAFGRPIGVITRRDLKLLEDVGLKEEEYVQRLSELSC